MDIQTLIFLFFRRDSIIIYWLITRKLYVHIIENTFNENLQIFKLFIIIAGTIISFVCFFYTFAEV